MMKKTVSKLVALFLAFILVGSFTACNKPNDNDGDKKATSITFSGLASIQREVGDSLSDAELVAGVTAKDNLDAPYTVVVNDKTSLNMSAAGTYVIKLAAKNSANELFKKTDGSIWTENRNVVVTSATSIDTDDFANLQANEISKIDFVANGNSVFALKRASFDEAKGLIIPQCAYAYAKFSIPAFAKRYELHPDNSSSFPQLEYNSSYFLRLKVKSGSAVRAILYSNETPLDITDGGIVVEREFIQFKIPVSMYGKDITFVLYNPYPENEGSASEVSQFSIEIEEDVANKNAYFDAMYKYANSIDVTEKFTFVNYGGYNAISRGDLSNQYSTSIDGFGVNARFPGSINTETTETYATNNGQGFWGKVIIPEGVKKIELSAGYVNCPVALRVALFDGVNYINLSVSDSSIDVLYAEADSGFMKVNFPYSNQKTYEFEVKSEFIGKEFIIIVEAKRAGIVSDGPEVRIRDIYFSKMPYISPSVVEGIDVKNVSTLTFTDNKVNLAAISHDNLSNESKNVTATSGGLEFAPLTDDKAVYAAKINVPSDKKYFKVNAFAQIDKTAVISVDYMDLKTYDVFELLSSRQVSGADSADLVVTALPEKFKGEVAVIVKVSTLSEEMISTVTVESMTFFDAIINDSGYGKWFSNEVMDTMQNVAITYDEYINEKYSSWTMVNVTGGSFEIANNAGIEFKVGDSYVEGYDWDNAAYIGANVSATSK